LTLSMVTHIHVGFFKKSAHMMLISCTISAADVEDVQLHTANCGSLCYMHVSSVKISI
jgi:hypothetical protein